MRVFVFLSVMALSLALEWLAIFKTGLFEKIMNVPVHRMTDLTKALVSSGSTWDFVICLSAVLISTATVSALIYAFIYTAYRVSVIASAPFSKD